MFASPHHDRARCGFDYAEQTRLPFAVCMMSGEFIWRVLRLRWMCVTLSLGGIRGRVVCYAAETFARAGHRRRLSPRTFGTRLAVFSVLFREAVSLM